MNKTYTPTPGEAVREGGRAVRPRDAATLVLLRRIRGKPHVLMGQRSKGHKFMPDRYVFPGGRIDRADYHVQTASELPRRTQAKLVKAASETKARALALTAVRETFEETGVIIGKPTKTPPAGGPAAWRPFYEAGFLPDLDGLEMICRAVTPPYRPIRFNARFFLAEAEEIGGTAADSHELQYVDWIAIKDARKLKAPNITHYVLDLVERIAAGEIDPRRQKKTPYFHVVHGKHLMDSE